MSRTMKFREEGPPSAGAEESAMLGQWMHFDNGMLMCHALSTELMLLSHVGAATFINKNEY